MGLGAGAGVGVDVEEEEATGSHGVRQTWIERFTFCETSMTRSHLFIGVLLELDLIKI